MIYKQRQKMKIENREFEVQVPKADGSGIAEKVKVMVPVCWDEEIQDWLMTPEAHELIDNTKARMIGLLLPAQLKELRDRYDYTQKEMGELFQAGEKSWTRWESGKHRPSRSINLIIRALYEGEISINYLLQRAGKPPRETAEIKVEEKAPNWLQQSLQAPEIVYSVNGKVAYQTKGDGKICFKDAILNNGNQQASFPVENTVLPQGMTGLPNAPRADCDKLNLKSA